MGCPPEIAEILLSILHHGLLRIRIAGWEGRPDVCAAEADHLHNLPGLVSDYSDDRLRYYWNAERPAYINRAPANVSSDVVALWEKLRAYAKP